MPSFTMDHAISFLIEADELRAQTQSHAPLIIDARTPEAYAAGHIPGSRFLSTYGCFVPDTTPAGMAGFAADVTARYAAVGVSHELPVVVYEDQTGMRAARELWILEYLGHTQVRMLHGGLDAWRAAGGELSTAPVVPVAARFEPRVREAVFVGAQELHRGLGREGRVLLDVRDADEYAGRDHTPCCTRRGHLPGAVWLEWTQLLADGRYRQPHEIRRVLRELWISEGAELVPYCHRGARSANTYYALRHAGIGQVRNFIGSFHEWSANTAFPVEGA